MVSFFFFKQKTAYEMVGSDWSSDVCSSDLASSGSSGNVTVALTGVVATAAVGLRSEERRVGKDVTNRVDLGGRRIIKKKTTKKNTSPNRTRQVQISNYNIKCS